MQPIQQAEPQYVEQVKEVDVEPYKPSKQLQPEETAELLYRHFIEHVPLTESLQQAPNKAQASPQQVAETISELEPRKKVVMPRS